MVSDVQERAVAESGFVWGEGAEGGLGAQGVDIYVLVVAAYGFSPPPIQTLANIGEISHISIPSLLTTDLELSECTRISLQTR